jgi:hypothetical protein
MNRYKLPSGKEARHEGHLVSKGFVETETCSVIQDSQMR